MARLRNITTVVGFAGVPAGTVVPFAGTTAPDGWLLCDGAAVSRTTYASLFGVVNTIHGAGDGSTTFNLPDLRQRFILGKADSGTGSVLGTSGGAIDHSHSVPAHHHAMGAGADLNITSSGTHTTAIDHSHSAGTTGAGTAHSHGHTLGTGAGSPHSHGHTFGTDTHGGHQHSIDHSHSASSGFVSNDHTHNFSGSTATDGAHGHTIHDPQHLHFQTINANPGSGNGSPPYQSGERNDYDFDAANLTAYPAGTATYTAVTGVYINADGPHSHSFSGTTGGINQNHNHAITVNTHSGSSGSAGSHAHSITGSISNESAHTHSITGSISNESAHTHSFTTPAFVGNSSSNGAHTHASGNIAGRIGLVSGGVDGNAAMTSGVSNPPFYVLNHIIKF